MKYLSQITLFFVYILAFLVSTESYAAIYQWNDDRGTTHFSDTLPTYAKKAQTVILPKTAISTATSTKNSATAAATPSFATASKNTAQDTPYKKILIKQPQNQETLQYSEGAVNVTLSLEPELKNNDKIAIYLDGSKIMETNDSSFTMKNVARGEHKLQAKINAENGAILLASPIVTFYIHQTSVLQ